MLVRRDAKVAERLLVPVLDSGATDHLGADEPGAESPALTPKCLHADARHRGEHDPRRNLDVADVPALTEVHKHDLKMVLGGIDPVRSRGYYSAPRRRSSAGFLCT